MSVEKLKNWSALFVSNFLGVFNDNLLKNGIIFFAVGWSVPHWLNKPQLITLASAALLLPYLLFSPVAGIITVRISKVRIFRFFKLIEIPVMMFAAFAFITENVFLALLSVLLMGIQSCLYSPSKYSLIRDIGGEEKAAFGSGVFETMSFLAILSGTVVATYISDYWGKTVLIALFVVVAVAGYLSTLLIKVRELPVEEEHVTVNPFSFLNYSYKLAARYPRVNKAVAGSSIFWMIGGLLQMNLIIHSQQVYNASNMQTGIVMAIAAIGIALGCTIAAKIAGRGTGRRLIVPGLFIMAVALLQLTFLQTSFTHYVFAVFAVAFSGGFLQVPNMATIQQSDSGRRLGELIAYLNLTSFIFILFGTLLFSVTTWLTGNNSFAVFGVLLLIAVLTLIFFLFDKKQTNE